jgi:hypothetical protein
MLTLADPSREAAIYFNADTEQYIVVQGARGRVASIDQHGDLQIRGIPTGVPVSRGPHAPIRGGRWVLEQHYHPTRPGDAPSAFLARFPSGSNGDIRVVVNEADTRGFDTRTSRIDFIDNGRMNYSTFSYDARTRAVTIDYPDPITGVRVRRTFDNPEAYDTEIVGIKARAAELRAGTPALGRDAVGTRPTEGDAFQARRLGEEAMSGDAHRQALATLQAGGASPEAIAAFRADVAAAESATGTVVRDLGLVGQPDSMARLHLIMNDTSLDAPMRQAIADAVVAATREHMIANRQLEPGERLVLILHGAPVERSLSMRTGGAQLEKVGSGRHDDFGRGLYAATRVEAAELYASRAGPRGEIFPFVLRGRDLGTTVDVSPGGLHRAEWEAWVVKNLRRYSDWIHYDLQGTLRGEFGAANALKQRGLAFDAFLEHLATIRNDPALARPATVLGDLGRTMTSGIGGGDQQAIRSQAVMDEMNRQMGFRARELGPHGPPPEGGAPPAARPAAAEAEATAAPRRADEEADVIEARSLNHDEDEAAAPPPVPDVDDDPLAHLRQLDVSITPDRRTDLARRVQAAADLLPLAHPMQEALEDIARGLPRPKPKNEGQDPVRRLINLLQDSEHGETIRRLIAEGPPPGDEAKAEDRREDERRALSAKRGRAEDEQVVGDLPERRLVELLGMPGVGEGEAPSTNARMREVELTPEYSLLVTDAPIIPSDAGGKIDPTYGARMADAYRALLGFSSDRNVAIAEVRVGDSSQILAAKSNNQQHPGMTHLPDAPEFHPFPVRGLPRDNDTERILLEHIGRQIRESGMPESDYGSITIRLYTEREPCESCSSVIAEFKKAFPGVNVTVSTSYR